jgi:hypothetical protein
MVEQKVNSLIVFFFLLSFFSCHKNNKASYGYSNIKSGFYKEFDFKKLECIEPIDTLKSKLLNKIDSSSIYYYVEKINDSSCKVIRFGNVEKNYWTIDNRTTFIYRKNKVILLYSKYYSNSSGEVYEYRYRNDFINIKYELLPGLPILPHPITGVVYCNVSYIDQNSKIYKGLYISTKDTINFISKLLDGDAIKLYENVTDSIPYLP